MNSHAPGIPADLLDPLINRSPWAAVVVGGSEFELLHWNDTFANWFDPQKGFIPEGLRVRDIIDAGEREAFHLTYLPHMRVFGFWEGVVNLRDIWGSLFRVFVCLKALESDERGERFAVVACKALEGMDREAPTSASDRELLHALLETLPMSVYFKDLRSRFIRTSLFKARKHGFTGINDLVGMSDFDLFTAEHAQQAFDTEQQIIQTGQPLLDKEERETYAEDHVTWASSSKFPLLNKEGAIVGTFGISKDITASKAMEEVSREMEMQQNLSQKLESIGRLASGVAHEINTPAQFISDNVQFLRKSCSQLLPVLAAYRELVASLAAGQPTDEKLRQVQALEKQVRLDYLVQEMPQTIEDSLEGLTRVRNIVRSLKEFSHPNKSSRGAVDLRRCIETTVAVSRHEWRYVAEMELRLAQDLPCIHGNFDEINQVLLNMIVNAAHAIEERHRQQQLAGLGRIIISTQLLDSQRIELRISDDGNGIPEKVRDHIFDPFFTTKEVGKGTGQGLAICRSIITRNHGGTISFETTVGQGTTFIIQLPVASATAAEDDREGQDPRP